MEFSGEKANLEGSLEFDLESEFSLGTTAKDKIQFKASKILEDARNQFKKNY